MSLTALLQHRLRAAWQRRGPLALVLWPLSRLYGALARRQAQRQQPWRLPVPVIVVGNVVAGGAGKTPVTLAVVQHLQSQGWRPGIVSRGHGRHIQPGQADCREVQPHDLPRDSGDEPLLLRRRSGAPVFVARRRAQAGAALLAAHPEVDVLVCDDGLQHHALARDVEICVFDARGIGNGWLLPAGPLREPWPRTLPAAHQPAPATLNLQTEAAPLPPHTPTPAGDTPSFTATRRLASHALRADGSHLPLHGLRGQPLHALAGIARPEAFFTMLRAAGLDLTHTQALPDHFNFDSYKPPSNGRSGSFFPLLCTEKDAAKLWPHAPHALAVPLVLDVPAPFFAALDAALHARGYHPRAPRPGPQGHAATGA